MLRIHAAGFAGISHCKSFFAGFTVRIELHLLHLQIHPLSVRVRYETVRSSSQSTKTVPSLFIVHQSCSVFKLYLLPSPTHPSSLSHSSLSKRVFESLQCLTTIYPQPTVDQSRRADDGGTPPPRCAFHPPKTIWNATVGPLERVKKSMDTFSSLLSQRDQTPCPIF